MKERAREEREGERGRERWEGRERELGEKEAGEKVREKKVRGRER